MSVKKWLTSVGLAAALFGVSACDNGNPANDAATESAGDTANPTEGADAAAEPDLSGVPDPVAEVNGEDVSKEEFTTFYESSFQQMAMQAQMGGEEVDQDKLKRDTLDELVDGVLLLQAADDAGHKADDKAVDGMLEELAQGNGMASTEEFITALGEQGMDEKTVRSEVSKQIKIEAYIDGEANIKEPTEKEMKAYYKQLEEQQADAAPSGESGEEDAAASAPESALPPYDQVKDQIKDQLNAEQRTAALESLIEELRGEADITSHL